MNSDWLRVASGDVRVRDAHCHEAVMWFVHHLTRETQQKNEKACDYSEIATD